MTDNEEEIVVNASKPVDFSEIDPQDIVLPVQEITIPHEELSVDVFESYKVLDKSFKEWMEKQYTPEEMEKIAETARVKRTEKKRNC